MSRLRPSSPPFALRRLATAAACAAVLLTSFEDEALIALATARAGDVTAAVPQSSRPGEASLFPDLSRPERGEAEADDLGTVATGVAARPAVRPRPTPGPAVTPPSAAVNHSPPRAVLCVWQI